jgi:hypothetical protein
MSAEPRWNLIRPTPRPVPASGLRADLDRNPARVLSAIALASIAAGAINIAAAATLGTCPACQAEYEDLVPVVGWLALLTPPAASPGPDSMP